MLDKNSFLDDQPDRVFENLKLDLCGITSGYNRPVTE